VTPETIAGLSFFWLLYVEVRASLRRVEYAAESEAARGSAYLAGVKFGAVTRCLSLLLAGLFALDGYRVAFVLFALLVLWAAVQHGRRVARDFGSGFKSARGYFPSTLAATVGAGWVAVTRGGALVGFSYGLRPIWG
jgi:hypothetical protein